MIHIIFDLDGTLADTQKIHEHIESDFLALKGVLIKPQKIGQTYAGRSPTEWIPECLDSYGIIISQDEVDSFVESKDEKVIRLLEAGKIVLMPGVQNTLKNLSSKGIKMGISSGACREFIDKFIIHFHLDMIEASTSANEVRNKKPAPDVFLSSFEKLQAIYGKPSAKWVVGDGKTDIIGGKAAGANTILCYHSYPINYDHRVDSFKEIANILK